MSDDYTSETSGPMTAVVASISTAIGASVGQTLLLEKVVHTLTTGGVESLCLAQISALLLSKYSYNEIHNRRVALGISCSQCTPSQLELLRKAGALPATSRRCGMITRAQAERLVRSFLCPAPPPALPETFKFFVRHECAFGCRGAFYPARYNSSRAKCIVCAECNEYMSPNKFVFHSHQQKASASGAPTPMASATARYTPVNAANFNSWRKHIVLDEKINDPKNAGLDLAVIDQLWEDIKSVFNGGVIRQQQHKRPPDCDDDDDAVQRFDSEDLFFNKSTARHLDAEEEQKPPLNFDLLKQLESTSSYNSQTTVDRRRRVNTRAPRGNAAGLVCTKSSPTPVLSTVNPSVFNGNSADFSCTGVRDGTAAAACWGNQIQISSPMLHNKWQPFPLASDTVGHSSDLLRQLLLQKQPQHSASNVLIVAPKLIPTIIASNAATHVFETNQYFQSSTINDAKSTRAAQNPFENRESADSMAQLPTCRAMAAEYLTDCCAVETREQFLNIVGMNKRLSAFSRYSRT